MKVWREHRGLSQAQLAARAGLPRPTIAQLETGRRKGTVARMKKLAKALSVSLDTLVRE